ncbi:helix-turn-helix transcriptional regulator [Pedobacter sp. PAMC26386]|nr:helix-turn-helix transcriptional regulator [Pedobacter sp. PAMC26386]
MIEINIRRGEGVFIEGISITRKHHTIVKKASMKSVDSEILLLLPDGTFDSNFSVSLPIHLDGKYLYSVLYDLQKILSTLMQRSPGKYTDFFMQLKICELTVLLLEAQEDSANHLIKWSKQEVTIFEMIAQVISQNLSKNFSIAMLAEKAGMNRTKLQAGFKEIIGQTINSYASELKMQKAKALLGSTPGYSLKEIAAIVGYSCGNHFSSAFKKKFSFSPSSFKHTINMVFSILLWDLMII